MILRSLQHWIGIPPPGILGIDPPQALPENEIGIKRLPQPAFNPERGVSDAGRGERESLKKDLINMASEEVYMDIQKIMDFLPHRYPFLLIDRVIEMEEGKRVTALKNVTINEPFFTGHFPGVPVMPGVLMVEAMAQAGGVLLFSSLEDKESSIAMLLGVDKCRWRRPVRPGDQLVIEVDVLRLKARVGKMAAKALVNGAVAAEAEITFSLVKKSDLTGNE